MMEWSRQSVGWQRSYAPLLSRKQGEIGFLGKLGQEVPKSEVSAAAAVGGAGVSVSG